MKKYTPIILGVLLGLVIHGAYRIGYTNGKNKAIERVIFVHDTTTVYDTITHLKPVYLTSTVVDSIPYPVVVHNTDTLWAQLPKTVREYGDSTFHAIVSGINPALERIDIFQKTQYINNTVYIPTKDTRKQFLELDARLAWDNVPSAPLMLNYGRKMGLFEAYAGGGYDVMQHSPVVQVGGRLKFKF